MKISISYPPIINEHGQKAMVSQNRNVQYFKKATYLLPVTHAHAATWLKQMGHSVYWDDGNAQLKTYEKWLDDLVTYKPTLGQATPAPSETATPADNYTWQQ